jgi:ectoine hydroxylase-related dioxygenase (phytanoyl-CoA dioxygenase family)
MNKPTPAPSLLADAINDRLLTASELREFRENGYVIVRGLIKPPTVAPLKDDIAAVLATRNMPDSYLAQTMEYLRDSPIDGLAHSPHLKRLVEQILGGPSSLYLPFTAVKGPGQGVFTFHQDNNYTRFDGPALNCWLALVPMTSMNGCLRIVPGSHRGGTVASKPSELCKNHQQVAEEPTSWVDVLMEPGDAVIFDRLTVHGSGPNRTSQPRIAYAVQFHRNDTKYLSDGSWLLLTERPRYSVGPVDKLSRLAQAGE